METLEVLICTINNRINNVVNNILPPINSINYLISWQQTQGFSEPVPISLQQRKDVSVLITPTSGLATNRNHALLHAKGDFLVLSDDDARYEEKYFGNILTAFQQHPEADILTFQMVDEHNKLMKLYPTQEYSYAHRPKYSYVSSLEIVIRRATVHLLFDTRFGIGSDYLGCGEEEVFIHQAYLQKLNIRYIPKTIVKTSRNTTGSTFLTQANVRHAKGAVLYFIYGYFGAILRCVKHAMAIGTGTKQKVTLFKDMYDGIRYVRKTSR